MQRGQKNQLDRAKVRGKKCDDHPGTKTSRSEGLTGIHDAEEQRVGNRETKTERRIRQ